MPDEDRYLTAGQAADFLKVNIKTVRDWADKGLIRHYRRPRLGQAGTGRRMFKVEDLEEFQRKSVRGGAQ